MDPKLPSYSSQFTPASQVQLPPELATVGPQGQGFGAPRAAFPGGPTGIGLRQGVMRPQGPQLRLSPNQLRLQLQQRLQGPQQVRTRFCSGGRSNFLALCPALTECTVISVLLSKLTYAAPAYLHAPLLFLSLVTLSSRTGWLA